MKVHKDISAYILCGGLSSRMTTEKGLVSYKGKPFIAHIIEAVLPITPNIYLVTKNSAYRRFGYPLVSDIYPNKGPVGGIYSALAHSKTDFNLVLSCDIPKIKTAVLKRYLMTFDGKKDLYFLESESNQYPLIGLYSKTLVSNFKAAILAKTLKLFHLIQQIDHKAIKVNKAEEFTLQNINSKEELRHLIRTEACL